MSLESRIKKKDVKIGIIGLGYVGLPLAVEFASSGFEVIGIDVSEEKVQRVQRGENYIKDVDDETLQELVKQGNLKATKDFSVIKELDAVSICVPTPLRKTKDPDVSYILAALDKMIDYVHQDLIVVLESTTYPGTTRDLLLPRLEGTSLKAGSDFYLAFSPERVDPGNPVYKTKNTPKVIGGITPRCTEIAALLYDQVIDTVVPVSCAETAEMVKLLENTFRAINIGLANEMALMCDRLGVDVWEVIEAAGTKPFGFMKFYPGPGLGGHCIPIDPFYLSWKMKTLNYRARFIELAGEINSEMPEYVVRLIMEGLNRHQKPLNGSKILILGVAYKRDIDDVRESPALDIMNLLQEHGAELVYHDPYVPRMKLGDEEYSSAELNDNLFRLVDAAVVVTDHTGIDYREIASQVPMLIDTRNVTSDFYRQFNNIIRLGT